MSERPTVHRNQIAEARNVLGEVIARARFAGEPTILVNRGKEAAVIVSHDFYEQALRDRALIEALEQRAEEELAGEKSDTRIKGGYLRAALGTAREDVNAALNITES
ncbi:type II toxin-antitoxin system Phd/YefM family antitoxin [Streptomyces tricolor]|uniref:Antitoxin n=1 Tax=Streptomyces tricolor TaxID=68277 RepID=A0ABS9JLS0_9ACTN|nr:type II toxin-antitoxin system Phd/YefM family antitoxin [Streptomyces tricolor]MCG0066515.1 type II toxin-antitoxin system Phd/YefM family antitoxin [Streptomyces tricolor]